MAMRTAALAAMALATLWLAPPAAAEEIPIWWSPTLRIESLEGLDAASWIALAAVVWLAGPAAAEEFPVWWSPALGIESLDDIDAMLAAPFAREQVSRVRRNTILDHRVIHDEDYAVDCRSHVLLVRTKFIPYRPGDEFDRIGMRCFILDALSRARPATVSYVVDFELSPAALGILPPLMRPWAECGYRNQALIANRDGVAWTDYDGSSLYPSYRYLSAEASGSRLIVGAERWAVELDLLARADLNGDGTQDLLIRTSETYAGYPTTLFPHLFLVLRDGLDSPLRIAWEFGVSALIYIRCKGLAARPVEPQFQDRE